jgi:hypothetical protein
LWGWSAGRNPERERNGVTNAFGFGEHDIICEAKDFDLKASQVSRPPLVVDERSSLEVLATVELNRETTCRTVEVEDVGTAGVLAPEFETGEALGAKPAPESGLGVGGAAA